MPNSTRITCKDCIFCRQCFEEDTLIGYRPYTKEAYEEFQQRTACTDSFKAEE